MKPKKPNPLRMKNSLPSPSLKKPLKKWMLPLCLPLLHWHALSGTEEQPNFLFILADDQSHGTVHAHGNAEVRTPNLYRLAAEGTSFLNAYNLGGWSGAICVASRTMITTGRSVWR